MARSAGSQSVAPTSRSASSSMSKRRCRRPHIDLLFLGGEQVDQQRRQAGLRSTPRHVTVPRAVPAAAAAVREEDHPARFGRHNRFPSRAAPSACTVTSLSLSCIPAMASKRRASCRGVGSWEFRSWTVKRESVANNGNRTFPKLPIPDPRLPLPATRARRYRARRRSL